jgi:arylsulfatase A-like enzyme
MPKLRRFAEESAWFVNATSQASWTKPAVVSLFTSLYPEVHNVQFGVHSRVTPTQSPLVDCLPDSLSTMATRFREAGYHTAAIQSNANLKAEFGFDRGFHSYEFFPYPKHRGDFLTERAIETLSRSGAPYFLYIHYMDPHHPYEPPSSYREHLVDAETLHEQDRALLGGYQDYYLDKVLHDVGILTGRSTAEFSQAGKSHIRSLYDGEVRFTDDVLDRLIRYIRDVDPGAIIVVTADHGEEFWEHGSVGHGKTVYQELVHVPLMISVPGIAPVRFEKPVETIDLLPTLSAVLGWETDPAWQGKNLLSSNREPAGEPRPTFASTRTSLRESKVDLEAVSAWPDKLVRDRRTGAVTLYRLADDGREQRDRAAAEPNAVARLEALLSRHQLENRAHPLAQTDPETVSLDPLTVEQLEALGYLSKGERPNRDIKP